MFLLEIQIINTSWHQTFVLVYLENSYMANSACTCANLLLWWYCGGVQWQVRGEAIMLSVYKHVNVCRLRNIVTYQMLSMIIYAICPASLAECTAFSCEYVQCVPLAVYTLS